MTFSQILEKVENEITQARLMRRALKRNAAVAQSAIQLGARAFPLWRGRAIPSIVIEADEADAIRKICGLLADHGLERTIAPARGGLHPAFVTPDKPQLCFIIVKGGSDERFLHQRR